MDSGGCVLNPKRVLFVVGAIFLVLALAYGWFMVSFLRYLDGPSGTPALAPGEQSAVSVIPLPDEHSPTYVAPLWTIYRGKFSDRSAKRVCLTVSDSGGRPVLDDTVSIIGRTVGGDPELSGSRLIVTLKDGSPSALATLTYTFDPSQDRFTRTDVIR